MVTLVSEPDSQPKGGVWYSCIHCNLQSVEFQWHESGWLVGWGCGTSQMASLNHL